LLEVVLPSVLAQTLPGFEVHVVDDASNDDSQEYVEGQWPRVRFLAHRENVGITRNFNRGIMSVTTPYVALLNNDVELAPDWLRELRDALEAHPEAVAADCKMLEYDRRERLDGAGDLLTWAMLPGRRGNGELDRGQYDEPETVFSVSGGGALFRRGAFDDVGLFDDDLFAYYEDIDWGFRAQLLGHTALYVPAAVAYHMGSATTNAKPGRWSHLRPRNQIYVAVKNLPGRLWLRFLPRILVAELYWLVADARAGRGREHLEGWRQALFMVPLALRKRRWIQANRRVSLDALVAAMTPAPGVWRGLWVRLWRRG